MSSPTSSRSISTIAPTTSLVINALISGEKWGGGAGTGVSLSYSFPWTSGNASFYGHDGIGDYSVFNEQTATNHYGLNATQQTAARNAFLSWANIANIVFFEVAETTTNVGDIRIARTSRGNLAADGGTAWGWAYTPDFYFPSGGDIWISTAVTSTDWTMGSHNFDGLMHEQGHALGLKHTFKTNEDSTNALSAAYESRQYSVMSYTNHPHSKFVQVTSNADGTSSWNSFNVEPDTPMPYDVTAIQYLYGPNLSYKTGNDVYTFDPTTPFIRTLWDSSGIDTISVSNFTKGCVIDLQQGHFSKITIESDSTAGINLSSPPPTPTYDGSDNLAIAFGCIIENAIGGQGNDVLVGNEANNSLNGGVGNDIIDGGAGTKVVP